VGMQGRGRRPSAAHGAGDRCGRAHGGARALTWRRDAAWSPPTTSAGAPSSSPMARSEVAQPSGRDVPRALEHDSDACAGQANRAS
jgi:hypothetical protein